MSCIEYLYNSFINCCCANLSNRIRRNEENNESIIHMLRNEIKNHNVYIIQILHIINTHIKTTIFQLHNEIYKKPNYDSCSSNISDNSSKTDDSITKEVLEKHIGLLEKDLSKIRKLIQRLEHEMSLTENIISFNSIIN